MNDKEPQRGERWHITLEAQYVIGGWWKVSWPAGGGGTATVNIPVGSPAIKSTELVPDPPYTPEEGYWFTDGNGMVWLCIADGWAARLHKGASVFAIESLRPPFTKVAAP